MTSAPMFSRELGLPARLALYSLLSVTLMFVDHRYDALATLRTGMAVVVHPLQASLARPFEVLGEATGFFVVHGQLLREKRRLEADHQALVTRQQAFENLQQENTQLRTLLNLRPPPGTVTQVAEITRVLPDPFSRKVLIDRGSADGVEAGRPAVDIAGLIGQVTRVYPASSEVTLLTAREQAAPVQNTRNGLRLIVSGTGSDELLEVRYLDMHADLKAGDVLATSGIDGVYPAGIPVARVLRVEPPRQTPFARAVCEPLGAVGQHRHLIILHQEPKPTP